jgi:hypothetical protein
MNGARGAGTGIDEAPERLPNGCQVAYALVDVDDLSRS